MKDAMTYANEAGFFSFNVIGWKSEFERMIQAVRSDAIADHIRDATKMVQCPANWSDKTVQIMALQRIGGYWYDGPVRNQWIADTCYEMAKMIGGAVHVQPVKQEPLPTNLGGLPANPAEQEPVAIVEDWPTDSTPKGIVALCDIKELPAGTLLYASPATSTEVFTREKVDSLLIAAYTKGRNDLLEKQAEQEPVAWKHDCAALCANHVELWIDNCPHCGKPRPATVQQAGQEPVCECRRKTDAVISSEKEL